MVDIGAFINVPILIIVYLLMEVAKKFMLKTDKARTMIPVIATLLGIVLGIIFLITSPIKDYSAMNVISMVASGAISGTAATGSNQIYKQVCKFFSA